ncbi:hypothetical protein MTR67_034242 [Solanum verrucosum]|uniref:Uncharacterized protein n=1 Tax=Solanum verrucosum TaxID=315347 RepID=A0AAF0U7U0_SOLVR|nr:hypothetical protein MTR67_034242 [Solanum verrucosum]
MRYPIANVEEKLVDDVGSLMESNVKYQNRRTGLVVSCPTPSIISIVLESWSTSSDKPQSPFRMKGSNLIKALSSSFLNFFAIRELTHVPENLYL